MSGLQKTVSVVLLLFIALMPGKVLANIPVDTNLFIFTVDATIADATAAGLFQLPVPNSNYQLTWEEVGNEASNNSAGAVHVTSANHVINFGASGRYRIGIDPVGIPSGGNNFDQFAFNDTGDRNKLLTVEQWGITAWSSMHGAFFGASQLASITAADVPDLSGVTDMTGMFHGSATLVTVSGMGGWDTSSVTRMDRMFFQASVANPDTSGWDTSSVTRMDRMFFQASVANPDTSGWDTSSVTNMLGMFQIASAANPDTSGWDTSSVTTMSLMFYQASAANPDTSSWDTSSVTRMSYMFFQAGAANPDTSGWDTSSVTRMDRMFFYASAANPDTSSWDTSSVTRMDRMFSHASAANPDTNGWDIELVATMFSMFTGSGLTQGNYEALLPAWSEQSVENGVAFSAGTTQYCEGETARNDLINNHGWVITDGGLDCTVSMLAEVLEDSASPGGSNNTNATSVTVVELSGIAGISNVHPANETLYQEAIAAETGFSNPTSVAEILAIINAVNATNSFIFIVDATIVGATSVGSFRLPVTNRNYQLTWEEVGNEVSNNSGGAVYVVSANHVLNFGSSGNYRVAIDPVGVPLGSSDFDRFAFNNSGDKTKLLSVEQWGTTIWSSMANAFQGATQFTGSTAIDTPDLSDVSSLSSMFAGASALVDTVGMGDWDTSSVTTMFGMFRDAVAANPETGSWNTSSVTDMAQMFDNAVMANPGTSGWDVSSVRNMSNMFYGASAANPDTSDWDTSSVTTMFGMFRDAVAANPETGSWNTSSVISMSDMFRGAMIANSNTSGWDVASVSTMSDMFADADLSSPHYEALLPAWSEQSVENGVAFSAGTTQYCEGETARNDLINNHGWVITDGGLDCTVSMLAEVLEDSASPGGSNNTNATSVTVVELSGIAGISNVHPTNEALYQLAIASHTGFSNPPTVSQLQAVIDRVNASEATLAEVLEDSQSVGGAGNANDSALSLSELAAITGIVEVNIANEALYLVALGSESSFSNPPTVAQVQTVIDSVNASEAALVEVLEDSSSTGGAGDANGNIVSAIQLAAITGINGIATTNEAVYQALIATETGFSNPVRVSDLQAVIDTANTSTSVLAEVTEDSLSAGGTGNANGVLVTAAQLSSIIGLNDVYVRSETAYQTVIQYTENLSDPPTLSELQALIAAANKTAEFVFIVDSTMADSTASGMFQLPIQNTHYQLSWEEVGRETSNNSAGAILVTSANFTIDFGAPGIYRIAIDPIRVHSGVNDFDYFGFGNDGDKTKLLSVEQWGRTEWSSMEGAFWGAINFTGSTATDLPDLSDVTSMAYMFSNTAVLIDVMRMGEWDTSSVINMNSLFSGATVATPDTSGWDTASVTNMSRMFFEASAANPDTSGWDTAAVTTMASLFDGARQFTGTVDHFDMSQVADASDMLAGRSLSIEDYDVLLIAWAEQSLQIGVLFTAGSSQYCLGNIARQTMLEDFGWILTDDGIECTANILSRVLDASTSEGADTTSSTRAPVTATILAAITGIENVIPSNEAQYQAAINAETSFSNPPTVLEVQAILDRINDMDGDGISDAVEQGHDTDNDSISDNLDLDSDNDGVMDRREGAADSDGDGILNFRDLDSDNDNIFDLIEGQLSRNAHVIRDIDQNGIVDATHQFGSDGLVDVLSELGQSIPAIVDTDNDGVPDSVDLDSDNDGTLDRVENSPLRFQIIALGDGEGIGSLPTTLFSDEVLVNTDGLSSEAGGVPADSDEDGVADYRDLDSDNDSVLDVAESFGALRDINRDGQWDNFVDVDNNGVSDNLERSASMDRDVDGDGRLNQIDTDSDGDGLSDLLENGGVDVDENGRIDNLRDANADGIDDGVALFPVEILDTDNDGVPDYHDLDSDNDGVSDLVESGGIDADGDGQADNLTLGSALPDGEGDSVPDHLQGASDEYVSIGLGSAAGCSIDTVGSTTGTDPIMSGLVIVALSWLFLRRRRSLCIIVEENQTHRRVLWVVGPLLLLTSASSATVTNIEAGVKAIPLGSQLQAANEQEDPFRRRIYLGVGAGVSQLSPDLSRAPSVQLVEDGGASGQLALGLELNRYFALEFHGTSLASARLLPGGHIDYVHVGGSALLYLGRKQTMNTRKGLSGFARIGFGTLLVNGLDNEVTPVRKKNSSALLLGAGLEYALNSQLSVRAELIDFQQDIRFAQLGLVYRFGRSRINESIIESKDTPAELTKALELPEDATRYLSQTEVQAALAPSHEQCGRPAEAIEHVNFRYDSAELTGSTEEQLERTANTLINCGSQTIVVQGHADSFGTNEYNQRLSEKRVESVIKYFEAIGISADRFSLTSFGERRPLDDNGSMEGRAVNRRVELIVH